MKLALLLLGLDIKLRFTALTRRGFRKLLRKKDCVLVIRTEKPFEARTFRFRNGRILSYPGGSRKADTELVWCDADTAVKTMLSDNELDAFSAIGRSQLRIVGNFDNAIWFMELAA